MNMFKSKCSIFNNIFKYVIFQRPQKVLLWSKLVKVYKGNNVMLITTSQKPIHLHDNVLSLTYSNGTFKNANNNKVL